MNKKKGEGIEESDGRSLGGWNGKAVKSPGCTYCDLPCHIKALG